jgi:ABC-type nitrate/sulfonate/bicarbonate transport system permease component
MCTKFNAPFLNTLVYAVLGGFLGIFSGLVLGSLIVGIGYLLTLGTEMFVFTDMVPPLMFCMGVGSIVGAVLAGLSVLRSQK